MGGKYSATLGRPLLIAFLAAASALLLSAPLQSCSRSSGKKTPAEALRSTARTPDQMKAAAQPQAPVSPSPAKAPVALLSAPMRGFGLKARSVPRIAQDFSLGPLQSYYPAPGDEAEVFALVKSFLSGLGAGTIDKSLLLPGSRDALAVILAPAPPASTVSDSSAPGSAPAPYRLGAIMLQSPEASLRIRLGSPAGAGRREGLLSLRKLDDSWYVEALALDPPSSESLAFNPNTSASQR